MQYHIANYGLSQIADQRRYNFLGLRNFGSDTLFLTATSPDFFHRMIVLVGKMMADGTWDTYGFAEDDPDGNGEFKYNVMKDPRFEKFTKIKNEKDPEYWQQKAMFEQYVNEFNKAGFTDENGKKLDMNKEYVVAMNSYISSMVTFEHRNPFENVYKPCSDLMMDYLRAQKSISYQGITRVTEIAK
jgi:hypothetical protein